MTTDQTDDDVVASADGGDDSNDSETTVAVAQSPLMSCCYCHSAVAVAVAYGC